MRVGAHLRREETVQAPVELRVLETVLSHQDEEAVKGEHASEAALVH